MSPAPTPAAPTATNPRAFVTFLTAGFPTADATVPLMLAMEKGGADIIELGVPFSDPSADGPVIQEANTVSPQMTVELIPDRHPERRRLPQVP